MLTAHLSTKFSSKESASISTAWLKWRQAKSQEKEKAKSVQFFFEISSLRRKGIDRMTMHRVDQNLATLKLMGADTMITVMLNKKP